MHALTNFFAVRSPASWWAPAARRSRARRSRAVTLASRSGCLRPISAPELPVSCASTWPREIAELESARGVELFLLANCSAQTIAKRVVVD